MYIYVFRHFENKQTDDLFCYKSSETIVFVKKVLYLYIFIYTLIILSKWNREALYNEM